MEYIFLLGPECMIRSHIVVKSFDMLNAVVVLLLSLLISFLVLVYYIFSDSTMFTEFPLLCFFICI